MSRFSDRMLPALALLALGSCGEEPIHVSEAAAPKTTHASQAAPLPEEHWRRESADGLVVELLRPGAGLRGARVGDELILHYRITVSGSEEELESTAKSGIPFRFRLGDAQVVEAWERGLVGLRSGSKLRIEAPAALCYGEAGHGSVPPNSDLVFEIDLVRVER